MTTSELYDFPGRDIHIRPKRICVQYVSSENLEVHYNQVTKCPRFYNFPGSNSGSNFMTAITLLSICKIVGPDYGSMQQKYAFLFG